MRRITVMAMILGLVIASAAFATIPQKLSYQGVLTTASGGVVPNGNYNLTLSLYDTLSRGSALWSEGQLVNVTNGIFNVILGSVVPIQLSFDKPLYLGVSVGGGSELSPRTMLTPAPYSLNAPVMAFVSSGATTALGSTWTNYEGDAVTLNCPGPGYVVVQSAVWMEIYHAANEHMNFYLAHDTSATGGGPDFNYTSIYDTPSTFPAFSSSHVSIPVLTVFAITSAGPRTFYLNGEMFSGTSTENFYYAGTTATWYPATDPQASLVTNPNAIKILKGRARN